MHQSCLLFWKSQPFVRNPSDGKKKCLRQYLLDCSGPVQLVKSCWFQYCSAFRCYLTNNVQLWIKLGLKDSSRANQLDCVISYFLTVFNAPYMCPKIRYDGYCAKNFWELNMTYIYRKKKEKSYVVKELKSIRFDFHNSIACVDDGGLICFTLCQTIKGGNFSQRAFAMSPIFKNWKRKWPHFNFLAPEIKKKSRQSN